MRDCERRKIGSEVMVYGFMKKKKRGEVGGRGKGLLAERTVLELGPCVQITYMTWV